MNDLYGAQVVTSFERYMINEGRAYSTYAIFTLASIGDVKLFSILNAWKPVHIGFSYVAVGGNAEIEIQEEPGVSGGVTMPLISRKRYGDVGTIIQNNKDVTVTEDGWPIFVDIINSSRGGKENLFVLLPSFTYLIKVTAKSAGVKVALQMFWFETES